MVTTPLSSVTTSEACHGRSEPDSLVEKTCMVLFQACDNGSGMRLGVPPYAAHESGSYERGWRHARSKYRVIFSSSSVTNTTSFELCSCTSRYFSAIFRAARTVNVGVDCSRNVCCRCCTCKLTSRTDFLIFSSSLPRRVRSFPPIVTLMLRRD